jgi:oligoribonuclease NrnB/cAMP/cGMP phosphodiesterase (DHH superfamily)
LCYSFRSFDINVDVSSLAKKVNGDGSKTAAGGRVKHEFPIIF